MEYMVYYYLAGILLCLWMIAWRYKVQKNKLFTIAALLGTPFIATIWPPFIMGVWLYFTFKDADRKDQAYELTRSDQQKVYDQERQCL